MASVSGHQMIPESDVEPIVEESSEGSRNETTTASSTGHRNSSEGARDDSVLFYYRTLQWLEAEVDQHTTRLHAVKSLDSVTEDNLTPNRTQELLQEKLTKLSTDKNVLKSMLQSVHLGQTMIEVMFQQKGEKNSKLQTSVTELVERTTSSVSDILRIHKENWTLQTSVANLKEECLVLRQETRELMYKLKQLQDTRETQTSALNKGVEFKRAQKECDTLTANLEMTQFVLQGLVFGSGLNWAEDRKLCDLVLSLGQPVEELLKEPVVESELTP